MSGTCGDSGGVDVFGKPCGAYPVRREQETAGRCRHHGDAHGEADRQERARGYVQQETEKQANHRTTVAEAWAGRVFTRPVPLGRPGSWAIPVAVDFPKTVPACPIRRESPSERVSSSRAAAGCAVPRRSAARQLTPAPLFWTTRVSVASTRPACAVASLERSTRSDAEAKPGRPRPRSTGERVTVRRTGLSVAAAGTHRAPALVVDTGRPGGQPVGQRVLRRLEAALNGPSRRDCWCGSDPKGSGAAVRKHARPRTRTEPSARRVASVTARPSGTPRANGAARAKDVAAPADERKRAVRIAGRPKCASDPRVVSALQNGSKSERRALGERAPARQPVDPRSQPREEVTLHLYASAPGRVSADPTLEDSVVAISGDPNLASGGHAVPANP